MDKQQRETMEKNRETYEEIIKTVKKYMTIKPVKTRTGMVFRLSMKDSESCMFEIMGS